MPSVLSKPTEEHTIGVAVNRCYGGFSLSEKAVEMLRTRLGDPKIKSYSFDSCYDGDDGYCRHHPVLIEVINELGEEADGSFAEIEIDYIEEKYKGFYSISEYDGMEGVKINYNKFTNHEIIRIIKMDLDDTQKVLMIKAIVCPETTIPT
jgi:hypothetical protein